MSPTAAGTGGADGAGGADNTPSPDPNDAKACAVCHGTGAEGAPPPDLNGSSSTTSVGVGAHAAHLGDGPLHGPIECQECHVVPTSVSSAGHIDSARPAEVIFGPLASTEGLDPTWDGAKCSGVYCHGASRSGGTNIMPSWTTVDGTQAACGSCHGLPPPSPHVQDAACQNCHGDVVAANNVITNKALHINGVVNVTGGEACNSCHGDATNNAPPKDTSGNTATTSPGVGAHRAHLNNGTLSKAFACRECHKVPSAINAPGHTDTALPAELTFGQLAKNAGAAPTYNGSTCSNTYCHGNFSGGFPVSPSWTTVNGTAAACGSCHDLPPDTGGHLDGNHNNIACSKCHGTGYSKTSVRVADHVNGFKNVGGAGSNISSWNKPTCSPTCHWTETW